MPSYLHDYNTATTVVVLLMAWVVLSQECIGAASDSELPVHQPRWSRKYLQAAATAAASSAATRGSGNMHAANATTTNSASSNGIASSTGSSSVDLPNDGSLQFLPKEFFRADSDHASLIIVFKQNALLEDQLRDICSGTATSSWDERPQEDYNDLAAPAADRYGIASTSSMSNSSSAEFGKGKCALLRGTCRRLYLSSMTGMAGRFSRQQFRALQHCLGSEAIDWIERDGKVMKAEHGDHTSWWKFRAPPGILQSQVPELLLLQQQPQQEQKQPDSGSPNLLIQSFSGSTGNNSQDNALTITSIQGVPAAETAATRLPPSTRQLWQWLLAEVGLAAQQQLAAGQPLIDLSPATSLDSASEAAAAFSNPMAAALNSSVATSTDGSSDTREMLPGVTSAAAAAAEHSAGSSTAVAQAQQARSMSRVTKNQDPGIPVDYSEISNPEISAFQPAGHGATAATRTSGDSSSSSDQQQVTLPSQPLDPQQAEAANRSPGVKSQRLETALWNLDRIDQRGLPLNSRFLYGGSDAPGTGKGVTIYTLDSGIKATHQEFQPWGSSTGNSRARPGPDFVDDDPVADDCDGHGTHVASTAAGRAVGVAKEANVVAVRVLDCDGAGAISNVVAALDWVASNAQKPAVASLSLGVPAGQWSRALEAAVKNLVAAGIPVVVASGNDAKDSCEVAPARVPEVITVGGSNLPSKFTNQGAGASDILYTYSNTGSCVDIFAPGVDILGACGGASRCEEVTDTAYTWATGTSMAAPHVTGWVAVYLEAHPTASPAEVHDALIAAATSGLLQSDLMLPGTPNRLLFSGSSGQPVQQVAELARQEAASAGSGQQQQGQ